MKSGSGTTATTASSPPLVGADADKGAAESAKREGTVPVLRLLEAVESTMNHKDKKKIKWSQVAVALGETSSINVCNELQCTWRNTIAKASPVAITVASIAAMSFEQLADLRKRALEEEKRKAAVLQVNDKDNKISEPPVADLTAEVPTTSETVDLTTRRDELNLKRPRDPMAQPTFQKSEYAYDYMSEPQEKSDIGAGIRGILAQKGIKRAMLAPSDDAEFLSVAPPPSRMPSSEDPISILSEEESERSESDTTSDDDDDEQSDDSDLESGEIKETSPFRPPKRPQWQGVPGFSGSAVLRLHNELIALGKHLGPSDLESKARTEVARRVEELAHSLWPECHMKVFGSASTGLSLPDSDVDIVLFDTPTRAIYRLSSELKKSKRLDYLEVVDKARIPIIKLRYSDIPFQADVSFGEEGGPISSVFILNVLKHLPEVRPLTLFVKLFLAQRELNDTFRGGIGSYMCFLTVVAVVQKVRKEHPERAPNLGELLLEYFHLYGMTLNVDDVGISLLNGGGFYRKRDKGFYSPDRPFLLSIENPEKTELDVGRNSWAFGNIRRVFAYAYRALGVRLAEVERNRRPENERPILCTLVDV